MWAENTPTKRAMPEKRTLIMVAVLQMEHINGICGQKWATGSTNPP